VILAAWEAEIGRVKFQGQPEQIVPPYKNNHSKMNWRCGSSGRVPALQEQNLEFKPQSGRKKGRKEG
jgi:hypothetical protein